MPYVDKVTVDNTTYDIRDTTTAEEVSVLESALQNSNARIVNIEDGKPAVYFDVSEYQTTLRATYTFDPPIPVGYTVSLTIGSIETNDTDSQTSAILMLNEDETRYGTYNVERNAPFELSQSYQYPLKFIYIYASNNYSHSLNDNIKITDLKITVYGEHYTSTMRANAMKQTNGGHNMIAHSPVFEQVNKVRRTDTIFNGYSFQSMIYVPSLNTFFAAGNISAATGESVFASFTDMFDLSTPTRTLYANMGHCNDMTYNSEDGMIYLLHGGNNEAEGTVSRNGITVISPSDFTHHDVVLSDFTEMQSIEYYNGYFYIRSGNKIYKYKLKNGAFVLLGQVVEIDYDDIRSAIATDSNLTKTFAYQMIAIKDDVIYYLLEYYADSVYLYQAKYTVIGKYSVLSGKCLGYIVFENDITDEAEAIVFVNENLYVVSMQNAFLTYYRSLYKVEYYPFTTRTLPPNADLNNILAVGEYCLSPGNATNVTNLPTGIDLSSIEGITVYISRFRHTDILQRVLVVYDDGEYHEYVRVVLGDTGEILSGWH